jgi:hypothetical protein
MTATWTSDDLDTIAAVGEIEIAPQRQKGAV